MEPQRTEVVYLRWRGLPLGMGLKKGLLLRPSFPTHLGTVKSKAEAPANLNGFGCAKGHLPSWG